MLKVQLGDRTFLLSEKSLVSFKAFSRAQVHVYRGMDYSEKKKAMFSDYNQLCKMFNNTKDSDEVPT